MDAPLEPPPSTGKSMIAAYRAARLSQRSALRAGLQQTHVARKAARCQALGLAAADPDPVPADLPVVAPDAPAPDARPAASVFASLVNCAVAERQAEPVPPPAEPEPQPEPEAAAPTPPEPEAEPEAEPEQPSHPVALEPSPPPYDPPLAEIGFGPGMLIRLSQLGLRTTGDLAHADAMQLRAALGDISRLVDVEAWISSARRSAPGTATKNSADAA